MGIDILIPFLILISLVIYLIYTRTKFEKNIVELYENKFEKWKKNTDLKTDDKVCKELVGLVYKEKYKLNIELLDESVKDNLKKGKFNINSLKG